MSKLLLIGLVIANGAGLALLSGTLLQAGHADTGLAVSDLTYGAIDADGDGAYGWMDDHVVEWLLENAPQHLTAALERAAVKPDGGVDISAHLLTFTAESVEAARTQEGN